MAGGTGKSFWQSDIAPGACLLLAAIFSMALANSQWSEEFSRLLKTEIGFETPILGLTLPLSTWIKDLLMIDGQLKDIKGAALPLAGAGIGSSARTARKSLLGACAPAERSPPRGGPCRPSLRNGLRRSAPSQMGPGAYDRIQALLAGQISLGQISLGQISFGWAT